MEKPRKPTLPHTLVALNTPRSFRASSTSSAAAADPLRLYHVIPLIMGEGPIITDTDIAKSTQEQPAYTSAIAMAMMMTVEALHLLAVAFASLVPIPVSSGDAVMEDGAAPIVNEEAEVEEIALSLDAVALDMVVVVVVVGKAAMMLLVASSHEAVDAGTRIGTKRWLMWRSWLGGRRSGVVGRRFRLRGGGMMSRHQG
jgi:hypothetical protein